MKDIIILADFCGPLDGTSNSRFLYLAELLSKENNVEIITSDFNHGSKQYFRDEIEEHDYIITLLHEGSYKKNVSTKRFYAHYIWGRSVKKYLSSRTIPDVIYCAVPTLYASYVAAKYCESNGIRFVIDIQDLWPEAFQMSFNMPVVSSLVFTPFRVMANSIYKRADAICAVSNTYCKRALNANKKCKGTTTVYLGTELTTFDKYTISRPILEKNNDEIWIAYCGTLGSSYDLTCVIDALSILANDKIKFIVMGDGPRKEEFEKYAEKNGVQATFTGRLKYDQMCSMLKSCDIAVNPITHMAAQSIINKHADYAAAGIPVISTQESDEYRELIETYHMGFNCKNNDSFDVAEKLKTLADNKELREVLGANGRRCAEDRFDRKRTYDYLMTEICNNSEVRRYENNE